MDVIFRFLYAFKGYFIEVVPALIFGFLASGVIHEIVPTKWIERYLGRGGPRPIFYSTVAGTILPICCWGSLPVALSFYKKGSRLGPVIAFLVATPATSVSALFVSYRILGPPFTLYIFFSVIVMGFIIGSLANLFSFTPLKTSAEVCPECGVEKECCEHSPGAAGRIRSILRFGLYQMPKEIGPEILMGLALAAAVIALVPLGNLIRIYLSGVWAYPFSIFFGLIMYFCSTASVPLVHALIGEGMNVGGGLVLLLVGPITSYGTILVLRKEFGTKILIFYLTSICLLSLILGVVYQQLL